jgi:hypothetical protein
MACFFGASAMALAIALAVYVACRSKAIAVQEAAPAFD